MKKRFSLLMAIILLLALCACGTTTTEQSVSDDETFTLSMSDEAKKYQKEVTAQDGIKAMLSEENFDQVVTALYAREGQSFPECTVKNELDSFECEGCMVYTLEKENYENVILYIHGGAWAFGIDTDHVAFCDALATKLDAKVYMPLYPLAPQATSEETYAMIETLYKETLKEGKNIYLMGDSAGGNIALGLLYTIKAEGLTKPAKTVLLSPCVDMSFSNEAMVELDKTDPELSLYGCRKCAELWAGEGNLKNPKNSALYADVTGYPDIAIIQGTNDILYPDVMCFYDELKNAGVNATLVVGEGFWHVFPIDEIPEKETVINLIADFCLK